MWGVGKMKSREKPAIPLARQGLGSPEGYKKIMLTKGYKMK
jgi:hypothetical protein